MYDDSSAIFPQQGERGPCHREGACEVGGEGFIPGLAGGVRYRGGLVGAGVVEEKIQSSPSLFDSRHPAFRISWRLVVSADDQAMFLTQLGSEGIQLGFSASEESRLSAGLTVSQGGGSSDSGSRSRYDGDLIVHFSGQSVAVGRWRVDSLLKEQKENHTPLGATFQLVELD